MLPITVNRGRDYLKRGNYPSLPASNAIDSITKPIKYVNCFFSVPRFGLGHEGGVYIPHPTNAIRAFDVDSEDWVLTPKFDKK